MALVGLLAQASAKSLKAVKKKYKQGLKNLYGHMNFFYI